MTATTITVTPTTIANKYNVTVTQLASATHCVMNDQHFVICESASQPGVEYKVIWNTEHQCLQCLPFNDGPVCKASESGKGCWHKRAALAVIELEKAQTLRQRQQEQREIESTPQYQAEQLQQAMHELEVMHEELLASQRTV